MDLPTLGASLKTVRVAAISARYVRIGDFKAANYARVSRLIREAAKQKARIICTTECFLDGLQVETSDQEYDVVKAFVEDVRTSEYVRRLKDLARSLGVYIAAGMAIADTSQKDADGNPKPFNSCQFYSPRGELVGMYYKTHNWSRRSPWFERISDSAKKDCFPVFATEYGKIGFMICNDRIFAETARWLAGNGAELILCPTGGSITYDTLIEQSRETGIGSVWTHPCGFAAIAPTGDVIAAKVEDKRREIDGDNVGNPYEDHQEAFIVDMPLSAKQA